MSEEYKTHQAGSVVYFQAAINELTRKFSERAPEVFDGELHYFAPGPNKTIVAIANQDTGEIRVLNSLKELNFTIEKILYEEQIRSID